MVYEVRYKYEGIVSTINGYERIEKGEKYSYPLYSDEWMNSKIIKDSIEDKSLPTKRPFIKNEDFVNPFVFFHFLTAHFFQMTGLDPITDYSVLPIMNTFFVLMAIYILAFRISRDSFYSGLAMFSTVFIVNGANIPSFWFFIPFTLSLGFFILFLYSLYSNKKENIILTGLLTSLIYPPFSFFVALSLVINLIDRKRIAEISSRVPSIYVLTVFIVSMVVFLAITLLIFDFKETITFILNKSFFRVNSVDGVTRFYPQNVLPLWIFILYTVGFFINVKRHFYENRVIITNIFIGIILWVIMSFTNKVFILEHGRAVIFTLILMSTILATPVSLVVKYFSDKFEYISPKNIFFIKITISIILVLYMSFYYPNLNWSKNLLYLDSGEKINPASPVNRYLNKEDIEIFNKYVSQESTFLSPPWKGTVLGVLNDIYPIQSKPSSVSINLYDYNKFMGLNCKDKLDVIFSKKIDYIYSQKMECEHLSELARSSEGLFLYKSR